MVVETAEDKKELWRELLHFSIRSWKFVATGAIFGLVIAITVAHLTQPSYRVQITVTPTSQSGSSALRNLGAISSAIGLGGALSGGNGDQFDYYVDLLMSRETASTVAANAPLMHRLFSTEWSKESHQWMQNESMAKGAARMVAGVLGWKLTPWHEPNAESLQTLVRKEVSIESDKKTRVTTISLDYEDPALASDLLVALNKAADDYLRQRTLERASQYIGYLQKELANVTVGEYRVALAQTLSEQEKLRMAASANVPFTAEPFGPPSINSKAVSPNILAYWIAGIILGAAGGLALAWMVTR